MPNFYTIAAFEPRAGALIHGAALTLLGFFGVCLILDYNWRHPALIPFAGIETSQEASNKSTPKLTTPTPSPRRLVTQGRGLFSSPGGLLSKTWSSVLQHVPFATPRPLPSALKTYVVIAPLLSQPSVSPART